MIRLLCELDDGSGGAGTVERLVEEYRSFNLANHDVLARPFEGTGEMLATLKARGYQIGVVTSKGRSLAQRGLELFGLHLYLDVAIFLEDTDRHKPDPDPIIAGLSRLDIEAEFATYVGDSPHDILAGKAAGVRTIAALWGPGDRANLERQAPDHLAESPASLLSILA
jgi:pyrophosphatase PpaX